MELYVWKEEPYYSLLDDTNEWSNKKANPATWIYEDPVDGIGVEIQFSYDLLLGVEALT